MANGCTARPSPSASSPGAPDELCSLEKEQARYNAPPFGGLYIGQPDKAKAAIAMSRAQLIEAAQRIGEHA